MNRSLTPQPPAPGEPVQVAVVGVGAFGRNHLRVYRELEQSGQPVRLAAIIEPNADTGRALATQYAVPHYPSLEACLAQRDSGSIHAASLCLPTVAHFPVANAALEAGIDVLLEKPITSSVSEANTLIATAQRHGRILQVGHLERFNPAVRAATELLNQPMFFEAHRLSIFTPRSLDVDVVLDLMIHDLDIVLTFAHSAVRDIHAVGLPVLSAKVDIANVRVEFASGCVANFTASRVSTERVRKLRFFQPHQYISIDYARQDLLRIDVAAQDQGESAHGALAMHKLGVARGEPLRLELEAFLESVRTRKQPIVSGKEGRAALALALDINASIQAHAQRLAVHTDLSAR